VVQKIRTSGNSIGLYHTTLGSAQEGGDHFTIVQTAVPVAGFSTVASLDTAKDTAMTCTSPVVVVDLRVPSLRPPVEIGSSRL
jgi:hypothetical protein